MIEVKTVAEEFLDARGGNDYSRRVREFYDVKSEKEGLTKSCSEAIVWW